MIHDLNLTEQVNAAMHLATVFHNATGKMWGDKRYINHPAQVVRMLDNVEGWSDLSAEDQYVARQLAWLHDTVEDTALTLALLRTLGFREDVIGGVGYLTHYPDVERGKYIAAIAGGPLPVKVTKRADMRVNMNALPDLWLVQRQRAERLRTQYEMEWAILHAEDPINV